MLTEDNVRKMYSLPQVIHEPRKAKVLQKILDCNFNGAKYSGFASFASVDIRTVKLWAKSLREA